MSRRQLRNPGVVDELSDALDESGLAPGAVAVEVTEAALMSETDEMVGLLDKFKALGVNLALDDFGTGYSSLSQLRAMPIDVVKIDRAFVQGIASTEEEWMLASAIVRLATSLHQPPQADPCRRGGDRLAAGPSADPGLRARPGLPLRPPRPPRGPAGRPLRGPHMGRCLT